MEFWTSIIALTFSVIAALVGGFAVLFYCFPHILVKHIIFRFVVFRSGMRVKFVSNGKNVYCYGEKNKPNPNKTSILFVHGFGSAKRGWISVFQGLPSDIHMVAIDLPGHGRSFVPDGDKGLSITEMVDCVHEFKNLVFPDKVKVHMVGLSLGGAITGVFAAKYPDNVERVTMLCPLMSVPVDTDLTREIKKAAATKSPDQVTLDDSRVLLASSQQDVRHLISLFLYHKERLNNLHDQIFKGFFTLRHTQLPYLLKMVRAIIAEDGLNLLESVAPKISVPSQVIWGKQDELIHVSGVEVLQPKLGDLRHVDLIDKCGHVVFLDHPDTLTELILKFYQEGESRKNN